MQNDQVEHQFSYHPPQTEEVREKHTTITAETKSFARTMCEFVEASPERTIALRKLQEARMWLNASLAIHGK